MIFGINEKINNFDQDTVLLAIATNIGYPCYWFCDPGSHMVKAMKAQ